MRVGDKGARAPLALLLLVSALAITCDTLPSRAGGLPKFDPEALCRAAADMAGQRSTVAYAGCLEGVRRVRREAPRAARMISPKIVRRCEALAASSGALTEPAQQGCRALDKLRQNKP